MRIIAGKYRGKKLKEFDIDTTRPTQDRVKESIFNLIQFDIQEAVVLDLFAGSGQLGIEALSRGARNCTFVENNRQAMEITKRNTAHCKLEDKAKFVLSDAESFLISADHFDIAFLDPPYGQGLIEKCLQKVLWFQNV